MSCRFWGFLACFMPAKATRRNLRPAPDEAGNTRRDRGFKIPAAPGARQSVIYQVVPRGLCPERTPKNDLEFDVPSDTLQPPIVPRHDHCSRVVVQPKEEVAAQTCKCGLTERRLFSVPEYAREPTIWLTITWIPCPVHPCPHSPPEDPEGSLLTTESPSETSSIDEQRRCLCNIYDQMRADPVASKQWYDEQCSIEFPSWVYAKPPGW
jgi:hypothetical protein